MLCTRIRDAVQMHEMVLLVGGVLTFVIYFLLRLGLVGARRRPGRPARSGPACRTCAQRGRRVAFIATITKTGR
jgi:hypothetical protein